MKTKLFKKTLLALAGSAMLASAMPAVSQEDFLGEISLVGFTFPPRGYANADGQTLSIASNTALFALYGTIYGGDGRSTFKLPDLRGRSVIHVGQGPGLSNYQQGSIGGRENVTLTIGNMPSHNHGVAVHANNGRADSDDPAGNTWSVLSRTDIYSTSAPNVSMSAGSVTEQNVGGNQSFNIRDPYLTMRYVVSLIGIFPSRN